MKKIFLSFILLLQPVCAADLSGFALPAKKASKTASRQVYRAAAKYQKDKIIKDALVLELPSNKFLGKKLNATEEKILDDHALEILLQGAYQINPEYRAAFDKNSKSQKLSSKIGSYVKTKVGFYQNDHYSFNYLNKKENEIRSYYQRYKSLFAHSDPRLKQNPEEIIEALSNNCGQGAVLELQSILKREEEGEQIAENF